MSELPIFSAPSVSLSPQTSLSTIAKSGTSIAVPTLSSPSISVGGISSVVGGGVPTSLSGAVSTLGIPTTAGGISSAFGGPTSVAGAMGAAGLSTTLPNFASSLPPLPSLKLPAMPNFPGLDAAGITLGAGPKFVAQKIAKLKTIVPPFAPGLKINMGMIAGALAIIQAMSSGNPSELLKQLTANIADDLKNQVGDMTQNAISGTGVSDIQSQVQGIQGNIQNAASDATGDVKDAVSSTVSENTSGGTANLNLSAVSTPINNTLSGATAFTNDKISAFSFPPSG